VLQSVEAKSRAHSAHG